MRLARNAFLVAITLLWAGTPLDAQKMEKMERSEALVGLRGLTVPPIERSETTNLIDAGTIDTDGYSYMTLNLVAELKGSASKSGVLGVLLLPDVEPFGRAWRVLGLVPASVDFTVPATPASGSYVMAEQRTLEVGFPRYRVLLYNTTGTSATAAFFVYRTRRSQSPAGRQ